MRTLVGVFATELLAGQSALCQDKDTEALKRENDLRTPVFKTGGKKGGTGANPDSPISATANDIVYVYKGMSRNGVEASVTFHGPSIRATLADGFRDRRVRTPWSRRRPTGNTFPDLEDQRMIRIRFESVMAVGLLLLTSPTVPGQTPIGGGFEITLPPGFTHKPLQGIDSIVGKVVTKDGMEILYEIGPVPRGGFALGGSYSNRAAKMPEKQREWLKEQTVGGRKFSIAHGKDQRLIVSTASAEQGINLSAAAKTSAEVADMLLLALSLAEQKPKQDK